MFLFEKMFNIIFIVLLSVFFVSSQKQEKPLSEYIDRFTLLAGDALLEVSNGSNVAFSPISIFHSFGLFHLGSSKDTREELSSIFGFPESFKNNTDYHKKFGDSLRSLQASPNITITTAAGIFAEKDIKLNTSFVEKAKSFYNANIKNVDFSKTSTTHYLNEWISQQTKDHIKEFFKESIRPTTKLQLISTFYLASDWKQGFEKTNTQKEDFHTGYSYIKVDMMSKLSRMEYGDDPKYPFRILGLPYKNEDFYFYIQLPRADPTSKNFSNNFSSIYVTSLEALNTLKSNLVHLKLPRFSLNTKTSLQTILQKFGTKQILTSPKLSATTEGQIQSVEVDHGVYINVDETGAEAAPISTFSLVPLGGSIPEIPVEFFVNKPFTFFIYCKSLKTILFAGAVSRLQVS